MTERPQNVRASRILDRGYPSSGHNSRLPTSTARNQDNQIANRSDNGSHRLDGTHRSDELTPAQLRSSRMGRRHVDHHDDATNRW